MDSDRQRGARGLLVRARLRTKLLLAFLLVVVVAIGATGWQAFEIARSSIERISFDRLTSIRETKKRQIEGYVAQLRAEAVSIARDPRSVELCRALAHQPDQSAVAAADSIFRRLCTTFDYADLLLVDGATSRVLFSLDPSLRGQPVGAVSGTLPPMIGRALSDPTPERTYLSDFAPIGNRTGMPASFVVTPINDAVGRCGVLIVRIFTGHINRVMTGDRNWEKDGLGRTGETYIVGSDMTMRTDSRFVSGSTILGQRVPTEPVRAALEGRADTRLTTDYRGVTVLSSFAPLAIADVRWVIVAEIDETEAFGPIEELRERFMLLTVFILALAAAFSAIIAQTIARPILSLASLAERFGRGDTFARASIEAADEIGDLAMAFNEMAENIVAKTRQLEGEIAVRIRAEDELRASRERLQNLSRHLQRAREEERKAVSREIHDELGQALTTIKLQLALIEQRVDGAGDASELPQRIRETRELTSATIQSVRNIITELRPGLLDDLGLVAAIEWQAEEFQKRSGIECVLDLPADDVEIDPDRATATFRIVQETLTNVARHAGAHQVLLRLRTEDDELRLTICDNGRGVSEPELADPHSFGLIGMRERALYWNGVVSITGAPGAGTTVDMRLPLGMEVTSP